MPAWGPTRRRVLIAGLRKLGFEGPLSNPHRSDIGPDLLALVLRQAGISRKEWERI